LDAQETWQWAKRHRRTLGLPEHIYVVCEALKRLWRDAHPATVGFWADCESAARSAILHPETPYAAGRVVFDRKGAWLRMRLPSGRYLLYPNPILEGTGVQYAAWCVYTKRWRRQPTFGGKFAADATQATARDIMAAAMGPVEDAGYPIVLTVHDELVTEPADEPQFTAEGLSALLSTNPAWAPGFPLAAKGFESYRYRKDD
jgi:DNA polymerase